MASNQELTIPYWVDNEQVVMAETSGDFVDFLFSLLTLPLGTIIDVGEKFKQPVEIGCINNLYKSVKRLTDDVFWNKTCKKMLLSPRNPLEESFKRLKVKVDDTEPTKYFMCHSCSSSKGSDLLLSTFDGARCYCGKLMRKEMELLAEPTEEPAENNGVFVKEDAKFLILDDLRVLRSSPSASLKLGHKNFSNNEEKSQNIGAKEIFSILKHALTSKSPLSDVFLRNGESKSSYSFSPNTGPVLSEGSVKIKVIVSKSQNKILFVEADGDFVDFLVSFLTTPLGSIMNLMNGKLSLGSIDNLYTSVKNLDPSWFIGSSNKSLLNPRIAPQFGCKNNPLNSLQEDTPKYWYGTVEAKNNRNEGRIMISKRKDLLRDPTEMKIFEPRCRDGARDSAVGFVKRPCLFVVNDDLEVKSMTNNSSISYLQGMQLNDLEEHLVEIRKSHEVLNLLMASLTSKAAFTRSLFNFCLLMEWKCQRCISFCGILGWKKKKIKTKKKKEKEERESSGGNQ